MPYNINQLSPRRYQVINSETGEIHSHSTSLKKAKAQVRLLKDLEKKEKKGGKSKPPQSTQPQLPQPAAEDPSMVARNDMDMPPPPPPPRPRLRIRPENIAIELPRRRMPRPFPEIGRGREERMIGGVLGVGTTAEQLYEVYKQLANTWNTTKSYDAVDRRYNAIFPGGIPEGDYFLDEETNDLSREMFHFVASLVHLQRSNAPFELPEDIEGYAELLNEEGDIEDVMINAAEEWVAQYGVTDAENFTDEDEEEDMDGAGRPTGGKEYKPLEGRLTRDERTYLQRETRNQTLEPLFAEIRDEFRLMPDFQNPFTVPDTPDRIELIENRQDRILGQLTGDLMEAYQAYQTYIRRQHANRILGFTPYFFRRMSSENEDYESLYEEILTELNIDQDPLTVPNTPEPEMEIEETKEEGELQEEKEGEDADEQANKRRRMDGSGREKEAAERRQMAQEDSTGLERARRAPPRRVVTFPLVENAEVARPLNEVQNRAAERRLMAREDSTGLERARTVPRTVAIPLTEDEMIALENQLATDERGVRNMPTEDLLQYIQAIQAEQERRRTGRGRRIGGQEGETDSESDTEVDEVDIPLPQPVRKKLRQYLREYRRVNLAPEYYENTNPRDKSLDPFFRDYIATDLLNNFDLDPVNWVNQIRTPQEYYFDFQNEGLNGAGQTISRRRRRRNQVLPIAAEESKLDDEEADRYSDLANTLRHTTQLIDLYEAQREYATTAYQEAGLNEEIDNLNGAIEEIRAEMATIQFIPATGAGRRSMKGGSDMSDILRLVATILVPSAALATLITLYEVAIRMYNRGQVVPLEAVEALAANLQRLPRRYRQGALQIIEAVDPDLIDVVNARARVTRVAPLQISRVVDEGDIEQGREEELRQARPVGGKLSVRDLRGLLKQGYNPKKDDYDGWTLDKSLSGQRAKVFQKKDTGEVAVVHRGTKGIQDWGNDLKYALGFSIKDSARVKHAKNIQKQAEQKYGKENVSTLGHSLGSKIGREVGKDSKEIISLNGAYAPQDLFKPISNKEFNIRTSLDPVSALLPIKQHKNTFTIPSVTINPLTEHSVDTLARVDQDKEIGKGRCGGMMKWLGSLLDKTPKLTEAQKVKAEEYADSLMSDPTGISFEGSSLLPKTLRKQIAEEFIKQKHEQIQMGKEDIQTGKGKGKQMSVKELKAYLKQNGKKGFQFAKKTKKELKEEVERRKGGVLTADQASEVSDTIDKLSGVWATRRFTSGKVKKAKEQIIKELSESAIQYEITDNLIIRLVTKYMTDY